MGLASDDRGARVLIIDSELSSGDKDEDLSFTLGTCIIKSTLNTKMS